MEKTTKPKRSMTPDTIYLVPEKLEALRQLAKSTRISRAELLREAVDDLLAKYEAAAKPSRRK